MISELLDCQKVDLTHVLHKGVPTWSGTCGFHSSIEKDYDEVGCRVMSYQSVAGVGTHMDAPSHFVSETADIAALSVKDFCSVMHY